MATNFVQIENDSEIKKRLETERMRLRKIAGLTSPTTFIARSSAPSPRKNVAR